MYSEQLHELGLFAGAGGGLLASRLLGWKTICAVEIEPYCQRVLQQRQHDSMLDPFPIWDDIRTFDGHPWRGHIDVISGGFPCQDISSAGKGVGLTGERSGLWFEMLRIIGEVQPQYAFIENSPNLRTKGLETVLQGLADLGYDAAWGVLGAWHVGAPHKRNRIWIVASHPYWRRQRRISQYAEMAGSPEISATDGHPNSKRQRYAQFKSTERQSNSSNVAPSDLQRLEVRACERSYSCEKQSPPQRGCTPIRTTWPIVPDLERMDDGHAHRVDRIRATGNAQVCRVAATAWRILSRTLEP